MAKMVGLSQNIRLAWLNKALQLSMEEPDEAAIKEKINEYLSFEIKSAINIRKSREILLKLWYYENSQTDSIRQQAKECYRINPANAIPLHWGMLLMEYPVFGDVSRLISKMTEFGDPFTPAQLRQKVFDAWGERSTLYYSVDKILATMRNLGVLQTEKGKYSVAPLDITCAEVASVLLQAVMQENGTGYVAYSEINSIAELFPFRYSLSKEQLMKDQHFTMSVFGGEQMVLPNT